MGFKVSKDGLRDISPSPSFKYVIIRAIYSLFGG